MIKKILRCLFDWSIPLRMVWRGFPIGSFELRSQFDAFIRPAHAYGMLQAVKQAKALGIQRISMIEFGVAQGKTFTAIQKMAKELSKKYGVAIELFGFDRGGGLPRSEDYRDIPYYWQEGDFPLNSSLRRDNIIVGDVAQTVFKFPDYTSAPIGFIAFDLDLYTPTVGAFKIFEVCDSLPRVLCYFDDVVDDEWMMFNEFTGELLAIKEFNDKHARMKLALINGLYETRALRSRWPNCMYVLHRFDHPRYNQNVIRGQYKERLSK